MVNGILNSKFKKKREVDEYGKTHHVSINTWKPEAKENKAEQPVVQKEEKEVSPDLPF